MSELVAATAQTWTGRCQESRIELRLECVPAVHLTTDPDRLRQVLDDLLDNSVHVTPAGAPIVLAVREEPRGTRRGVRGMASALPPPVQGAAAAALDLGQRGADAWRGG